MSDTKTQFLAGAVLVLAILTVVAVLGWHGTLSSTQVYGIITTIVSIAGAILAVGHGATSAVRAMSASRGSGSIEP